ncbi:protein of unknown function [Legionella fallonii LLAP-10]|uniref:Uncharacterized protein n=2 Tax=Legionella fallonii TaxID=96230 RepID=A0A098G0B4_9GAMM|nr:protein of unknown function [Legionella fallonii LLAP-10]
MYLEHADFKNFYNAYHSDLAASLVEAMTIFAQKKLS